MFLKSKKIPDGSYRYLFEERVVVPPPVYLPKRFLDEPAKYHILPDRLEFVLAPLTKTISLNSSSTRSSLDESRKKPVSDADGQMEALVAKVKQLECTIQLLESEKELTLASKEKEIQELRLKNNALMVNKNRQKHLVKQRDTVSNKRHQVRLDQHDVSLVERQFLEYRHYMENTVVPYLRKQQHVVPKYKQVLLELLEAKRFINQQAHHMDILKSNIHWLKTLNQQYRRLDGET